MFRNILIATDGSDLAQKAVEKGIGLAKALSAKVTIVTVSPSWTSVVPSDTAMSFPVEEYIRAINKNAEAALSSAATVAMRAGVEFATIHEADQFPAEGILSAAKQTACDLVVMASHGRRGLQRLFLGSQAQEVLTHSSVPVLICR